MSANIPPLPFMGETMACRLCGQTQQADPQYNSGWAMIQINHHSYYLCPPCAGFPDPQCSACGRFYDRHTHHACPWCTEPRQ